MMVIISNDMLINRGMIIDSNKMINEVVICNGISLMISRIGMMLEMSIVIIMIIGILIIMMNIRIISR